MTGKVIPPGGAGGGHKKAKLLYLMRILLENTDERHGITMPQIMEGLNRYGIRAERKSIYDDLSILKEFGLDIRTRKSAGFQYYVCNREFSPAELKQLTDAVQNARFIAPEDAGVLLTKLKKLTSVHEAAQLHRSLFIAERPELPSRLKELREQIETAIHENRELCFCEFHPAFMGGEKRRVPQDGGELRRVRPCGWLQAEDTVYLLAYHYGQQALRHYRLDRLCDVKPGGAVPQDHTEYGEADLEAYIRENFSRDSGKAEKIRLEFDGALLGDVIDRFGEDLDIKPAGKDQFRVMIMEMAGPDFFAWLFRFGADVKVLSPKHVAEQYRETARAVFKSHKKRM